MTVWICHVWRFLVKIPNMDDYLDIEYDWIGSYRTVRQRYIRHILYLYVLKYFRVRSYNTLPWTNPPKLRLCLLVTGNPLVKFHRLKGKVHHICILCYMALATFCWWPSVSKLADNPKHFVHMKALITQDWGLHKKINTLGTYYGRREGNVSKIKTWWTTLLMQCSGVSVLYLPNYAKLYTRVSWEANSEISTDTGCLKWHSVGLSSYLEIYFDILLTHWKTGSVSRLRTYSLK